MKSVLTTTVLNLVLVHDNQDKKFVTFSARRQNMVSCFRKGIYHKCLKRLSGRSNMWGGGKIRCDYGGGHI